MTTIIYNNKKRNNNVNKKLLMCLVLGIFLFSFANALEDQITGIQNECINISQTCSSCSYVNISSISNKDNSNLVLNQPMTSIGNGEWRYEFCDTSTIGDYDIKGQGDKNGVDTTFATRLKITPGGFVGTLGFYFVFVVLAFGVMILGFGIKDGWTVVFGAFLTVFLGLFIIFYGIDGMKDTVYTWAISIIIISLGSYIGVRAAMDQLE